MEKPLLIPTNPKFIFFLQDCSLDGLNVRQYEIGIVEEEAGDVYDILVVSLNKIGLFSRNQFEFFNPDEVGDDYEFKVCNVCQRILPTVFFQKNQNAKDNRTVRRPSCNDCREIINGVKVSARERAKWTGTRPHLVPFRCPICEKITIPDLTSKVVLDHDHTTGKIRGWICDSCNTGIGRFKDDVTLLKKAIHYLEEEVD